MKLTENEKRDAIKLIETAFLQPWPKFLLNFGKNME
jgi:hypothetical protein